MKHEPKFTNRLIHEKSPYLLQHAHNPVQWYPWGEEAVEQAKKRDVPIFLSIGYSTCHWCHVMAEESFDNERVAETVNAHFVPIKVDREERPDLDQLYMEYADEILLGPAGWPLNLVLTHSLEPFFAATYLPPFQVEGMMGLEDVLLHIHELWLGEEREQLVRQAGRLVHIYDLRYNFSKSALPSDQTIIHSAVDFFCKMADPIHGGLKGKPKFPLSYQLVFLMEYSSIFQSARASFIAEQALIHMAQRGLYDHLGGGFYRYCVDEEWRIPHFEKMLCDNALLVESFLLGWKYFQRKTFKTICEQTFSFLLREMADPTGGFHSAIDADSEGGEGRYYTWTEGELASALEGQGMPAFTCSSHRFEEERSILCARTGADPLLMEKQRTHLLSVREEREKPWIDDKILVNWNAYLMHALALAGVLFQKKEYLQIAVQGAEFMREKFFIEGILYRRYREGEVAIRGGLSDYASLIRSELTLFETGCGTKHLLFAFELLTDVEKQFGRESGGYYATDGHDLVPPSRLIDFSDGSEPSGIAIHTENLIRLYRLTWDAAYLRRAESLFKWFSSQIKSHLLQYAYHVKNFLQFSQESPLSLIVALNANDDLYEVLRQKIFLLSRSHRFSVIWFREKDQMLLNALPHLRRYPPLGGQTSLYACRQGVCELPLTDMDEIEKLLISIK